MMTTTIFTPTHTTQYLLEAYNSIKDQSFDEWIIVYNNGAKKLGFSDSRVKEYYIDAPRNIGFLKNYACSLAKGDILIELDSDDLLNENAIKEIKEVFETMPNIGLAYSNTIYSTIDFQKVNRYDECYGWQYRETVYKSKVLDEHIAFDPSPASFSKIWYAPNHIRAFRKTIYDKIGGHNATMSISDDQDILARMYLETESYHIDKPLYVYRVHNDNTWKKPEINKEIQNNVWVLYDKYIEKLALTWARRNNLLALDLGGGVNPHVDYTSVDKRNAQIICDLDKTWCFKSNSIGVIRAYNILEHLYDPIHTMKEMYRVLVPGGYVFICIPSTDGRGAFQDPTHVSFWNENSFLYYTDKKYNKYIECPVRFQAMRLYTTPLDERKICWTITHLMKIADGMRIPGKVFI